MSNDKPTRGRPKTLDRDHIILLALQSYWQDGPTNVSINDICLKSGASKPGVYREFGNDDGLKCAVLDTYATLVLSPLYEILNNDQSFQESIDSLIALCTQDRTSLGLPNGCLQVIMRGQRDKFEMLTKNKIDELRERTLNHYRRWIDRAKAKGETNIGISTETAALFFDAQNYSAMCLQKEGIDNKVIAELLRTAFLAFK